MLLQVINAVVFGIIAAEIVLITTSLIPVVIWHFMFNLWAVILKEGDVFIGDCGITMQDIGDEIVPEIGFHIIKEYCNKGFATEAALACKEYAFRVLNYPKIFSYCTVRNIPSQKVAEKIGMHVYKHFEKNGEEQIVQVANNHGK